MWRTWDKLKDKLEKINQKYSDLFSYVLIHI